MQRTQTAVSIAFVLTLFLSGETHVFAATPTPAPTISKAIIIPNGSNNETLMSLEGPSVAPTPHTINFGVSGLSVNPDTDNFKIPKKLDPISTWLINTLPFMGAKSVNEGIIPHDDNLYISGQARRCVYPPGQTTPETKGETGKKYITPPIPYLAKLFTSTGMLSALTARNNIPATKVNGTDTYNLNGPAYEMDEAPPCGTVGDDATPQTPTEIPLVQGFNIAQYLLNLLSGAKARREVVSKQLTAGIDEIYCQTSGCTDGSANLSYLAPTKQATLVQTGGIDSAFRTVTMDTTKGESPDGEEENFTKTNTTFTKQIENSANLIMCSLVPKEKRNSVGLTDADCEGFIQESCGPLPSSSADQACKICNADAFGTDPDILTSFEMSTLPNGLPANAIKVLEAAAQTYQVPAAVLLQVMLNEGSFEHPGVWDWTDANVEKWSDCGAQMPSCEAFANPLSNAKGAFGFLKSDWEMFKEAILKFDPNRPKDKLSPCNFADAAFASAKEIHDDASHLYVDQTSYGMPPDVCTNLTPPIPIYKGRDIPMSCSVWTPQRVALTEWQYGERLCNTTISRAVYIFKNYSCR